MLSKPTANTWSESNSASLHQTQGDSDLEADEDTYFVLSSALTEWADSQEAHAEDNEPRLAADRRRWAGHARELLTMTEEALSHTISPGGAA